MSQSTEAKFEYWTAKRVQELTGYSRVTLWRKSRDPNDDFPAPHQLSANRVAWRSDAIMRWLNSRPSVHWAGKSESAAA